MISWYNVDIIRCGGGQTYKWDNITPGQYNVDIAKKIITFIQSEKNEGNEKIIDVAGRKYSCLAAFKVLYGLAMKEDSEQLGFTKTYRQFVRLIGRAKRADTGNLRSADENELSKFNVKERTEQSIESFTVRSKRR